MSVYNSVSLFFCGIIMLAKGQIYDAVVCSESTVPQTITCGGQGIIEIESVTVAAVHNRSECSYSLTSVVERLDNRCRRTDVRPRDGKEVFRRCFGEESCTFDDSVVDHEFLGWSCDPEQRNPYTNVLWFKYSCHLVDPHSPSVALLPLPENWEVQGLEVDIFSPYYPCFTPVPDVPDEDLLVVECTITPQRTFQGSYVTLTVLPKQVEIPQSPQHCQDFLYFDHGPQGGRLSKNYCGGTRENLEVWNDVPITDTSGVDLHIKYRVQPAAIGAKFWLRVTAVEGNRNPVNVSVTCSGQENVPPLPSDRTCIPLTETLTTSTNVSPTTEATTTAPSTINSNTEPINTEENKSGTSSSGRSKGLLPGILGGVFGLLFVGAIVVTLLCCVIRKRKGQTKEAGKSETRRSRPKSIQEIVATIRKKKRAPNHPDEEMANGNNSKTKPEKPPKASKPTKPPKPPKPDTTLQTYVRPSSIAKMAALLKKGNNTKRKATNNKNKNDPEADEKAGGKSMEINDRYENMRKTSNVNEESRYEHLYAVPLRKESKFSESDGSKSKTTEVNATNPDETLMYENNDLYSSVQVKENNAVSEKDDGVQVVENKIEDTDNVAENAVRKETLESATSGYENVKPDTTDIDKNNNDKINNETCTITVPDDFSNNPGSRISLA